MFRAITLRTFWGPGKSLCQGPQQLPILRLHIAAIVQGSSNTPQSDVKQLLRPLCYCRGLNELGLVLWLCRCNSVFSGNDISVYMAVATDIKDGSNNHQHHGPMFQE